MPDEQASLKQSNSYNFINLKIKLKNLDSVQSEQAVWSHGFCKLTCIPFFLMNMFSNNISFSACPN